ncbi:MAG TPA: hypothetical protein VJN43_12520 [Bryobacteraceae bacterium]|nr:hypothetical protein [Bryobacteraceae bacterium]
MLKVRARTTLLFVVAVAQPWLLAQDESNVRGITLTERILGDGGSVGLITKFDTAVGYRFNRYFAVEGGFPVYAINPSSTFITTTGTHAQTGMGDAYVDVRLYLSNPAVNYYGVLTAAAPTGDRASGLSTGRPTFDWSNLFDRSFGPLMPFAELGIGNTILDQAYFIRPFTSLGFVSHLEGGVSYKVFGPVSVGGSLYAIEPSGQQKVFSKLFGSTPGPGSGNGHPHHGVFENPGETVGTADITRDHGVSAWVGADPSKYVQIELGYSRSMDYSLDSVFFGVTFNLGSLIPIHR